MNENRKIVWFICTYAIPVKFNSPQNLGYFQNFRDRILFIRGNQVIVIVYGYVSTRTINLCVLCVICTCILISASHFCVICIFFLWNKDFFDDSYNFVAELYLVYFLKKRIILIWIWRCRNKKKKKWWSVLRLFTQTILHVDFQKW